MRLIPGKTKVHVELFRGVTLGDILICAVALAMLIFVLISNLPWKLGICIGIAVVAGLLLVRMDEQPNYIYLLHILSFFSYRRRFGRVMKDQILIEAGEDRLKSAAFDVVFKEKPESSEEKKEEKKLSKAEKKQKEKEKKLEAKAEKKAGAKAETKTKAPSKSRAEQKAEAKQRKKEDKLLKNKHTPEEVKEEILARRAEKEETALVESIRESVSAAAEDAPAAAPERIKLHVVEHVVHEAHVPLEGEAQSLAAGVGIASLPLSGKDVSLKMETER